MNDFYGMRTGFLESRYLRIEYLTEAGPRFVRLFLSGSEENLLAELPNLTVDTSYGPYHFYGGHRLWHSPEAMPRTYIPDNQGLVVEVLASGVRLTQPVEAGTGIQKTVEILLSAERAELTLHHTLSNQGLWPVELSAWAITQLALGGKVILPQKQGAVDPHGLLPNRQLVLWPYTLWHDPRLRLGEEAILVDTAIKATPANQALKVGYRNPYEWIAYWRKGVLFVKKIVPIDGGTYPDGGCNIECYCNDKFVELESLGPVTRLEPGSHLVHTEVWELYTSLDVNFMRDEVRCLLG